MKICFITLFPEMFAPVLETSMARKAQNSGAVSFQCLNLRQFGLGPRRQVDDTPYGGGSGMLLRPEPLVAAIEAARQTVAGGARVILMTPKGRRLTQAGARRLANCPNLILVCGRYEGYDERVSAYADEQISIGDYILTGGELPAMVVADCVMRLLPGVLGGADSAAIESFSPGLRREFPQYTRPAVFRGQKVPAALLSGDHARIARWRRRRSI